MSFRSSYLNIFLASMLMQSAIAGSGFYYGFDALIHSLDTKTEIGLTYTPPPPDPGQQFGQKSQSFSDAGFHIGYLYKHRRTQNYFMAPELFIRSFDLGKTIYGTSFKFGTDIGRFRVLANLGVSQIKKFRQNKLHLGLGAEYAINDHQTIGIDWIHLDSIDENTTAESIFGSQTLTTDTHTERDIEFIKISFRIYFHE